jgi:hypothetical protein
VLPGSPADFGKPIADDRKIGQGGQLLWREAGLIREIQASNQNCSLPTHERTLS